MLLPNFGVFHVMLLFLIQPFFMILSPPNCLAIPIICVAATMLRLPASEHKTSSFEDEKVGVGCTVRCCLNKIKKRSLREKKKKRKKAKIWERDRHY